MSSELASTTRNDSSRGGSRPGEAPLIEVEQVSRYRWAAQTARGRMVLDAGCGTGYGSRLLAEAGAREVIGFDLARVVPGMATPGMPGSVHLKGGDMRKLAFEDDRFELVVCFEVIEYIEDPLAALDELVRVLAPGGLLLVSAPNPIAYQPGKPYQLHEFAPTELEAALAARLTHVQLVRQYDYVASGLAASGREGGDRDLVLQNPTGDAPGDETYTIAMASDAELPVMRDLVVRGDSVAVQQWLGTVTTLMAKISEKDDQIEAMRVRLEERDRLAGLLGEAEGRAAEVPELKLRITDLELELEDERRAAAAARKEADQLDRMLMYGRRMLWLVTPLIEPLRRLRRKLRT